MGGGGSVGVIPRSHSIHQRLRNSVVDPHCQRFRSRFCVVHLTKEEQWVARGTSVNSLQWQATKTKHSRRKYPAQVGIEV